MRRGEGAVRTNSGQSHPLNLLRLGKAAECRLEQRKRFLIPKAATHSLSDVGARPARPPSWEHGGPGQGSFLTLPRTSLSPPSSRSAPAKRYSPCGGNARDLTSALGLGRFLGPSHLSWSGKAAALLNRNGNWNSGHRNARRSPESYAFSACLDVSFAALKNGVSQEEKEPARAHSPLRR